ncbi:MAG: hypothetical protein U9R08_02150 [Nanoarchaeota archaeon]|nr:hypothetical protein [Nanoarchaeota archaeon]
MNKVKTFFLTYAFLIAVVFIVILLLSTSHIYQPDSICQLDTGFSCRDVQLTPTGITFQLYNEQDSDANMKTIAVIGDKLSCNPDSANILAKTSQLITLTCTKKPANSYDAKISITYNSEKTISGRLIVK